MAQEDRHGKQGTLLPPALVATLAPLLGDEVNALEAALNTPPPVSIRSNTAKSLLPDAPLVPWCAQGRYLPDRPAFTFDPLLHAGAYYVQEASSMLLEQAVLAAGLNGAGILALDLCAAPGGKTTHLCDLLGPDAFIVANEVDGKRRAVLSENRWKWGHPGVAITGRATAHPDLLHGLFDLVLLDAPCSGEGMFRKDAFAREQWSTTLVEQCAATQRGLVAIAWQALAPGGVLIYSTCTWEPAENEEQLVPLMADGAEPLGLALDPAWGVERTHVRGVPGHRCYPHRVQGEGFFIAVLRKPGTRTPRTGSPPPAAPPAPVGDWFAAPEAITLTEKDDIQYAVPARWAHTLRPLLAKLRADAPGIPVAERKGRDRAPHPALATNALLAPEAFPRIELCHQDALRYLRGETLTASGARGAALVTHQGLALGWVHGAGNRWNNRWPAMWRIRAHAPAAPPVSWAADVDR
jgi:16S rRNA C967 or C1407 C5-methylase (RsmB/RsmF family)/NOL1/NOP2/fmu family ribosome biogenesis protein